MTTNYAGRNIKAEFVLALSDFGTLRETLSEARVRLDHARERVTSANHTISHICARYQSTVNI